MAYGRAMRQLARVCLVGIIACGALGLGGCVRAGPDRTPNAVATSKPVFESDAAALAAATKAYAAYLAMSDTISQEGGANPERLASLVTPDILKEQVDQFHQLQARGFVAHGSSEFDTVSLQHLTSSVGGEEEIYLYLCLDVSKVRVLDSARKDV
ncbi:MAG: hypothetical protein QOG18_2572, partial [Microbacteriaceae bacterium]|nr:hypothetical protein [Microbacteriaceae bacterium]